VSKRIDEEEKKDKHMEFSEQLDWIGKEQAAQMTAQGKFKRGTSKEEESQQLERDYHHLSIWISTSKGIDGKLLKIDQEYIKFLLTEILDKKLKHKKNECGLEVNCLSFQKKV
jgi:hypothetical protein